MFLPEARRKQAEIARARSTDPGDWKPLYEEQIEALNLRVKELEEEAEEWADDASRTAQERDQFKDENRQLRFQVDSLRQALSERTGGSSETEIPIPATYEDLPDWVSEHLSGRVYFHSRANRGLKNADFEDIELVYRSLLLLANHTGTNALVGPVLRKTLLGVLRALGLRLDRSISDSGRASRGTTIC